MKKVKKAKQPKGVGGRAIAWFFAVVVFIALVVMWHDSHAATYSKTYEWRDPDAVYDSVLVRIMVGATVRDTIRAALGDSLYDTVVLDQDTTYFEDMAVFYTGGSFWTSLGTTVYPRWTAGTATVDYNGKGDKNILLWAVDTSGTDDSVSNVTFSIATLAGTQSNWPEGTDSDGKYLCNLDTGSYVVTSVLPWYNFPLDTITVTANDTFTISGYNRANPSAPVLANMCTVYGYIYDLIDTGGFGGAKMAKITFTLPKNTMNTCDSVIMMQGPQFKQTDQDGYFEIDLIQSECVGNQKYDVIATFQNRWGMPMSTRRTTITVPDSSTYKLVF